MSAVLITGAGSGIGKELAVLFAEKKFDLFLLGKNYEKLKSVQKEILNRYRIKCDVVQYDLNDVGNLDRLIENYDADIIVNCAGTGKMGNFEKISQEDEIKMINVNFVAPMILSKLAVKKFVGKKTGTVINICSAASLYPNPYLNVYSASKVSLLYYSLALDKEISMKNKNVRVLSICPGPVNTNFFDKNTRKKFISYIKYEMSAYKAAKEIMKAFESKKRFSVIGSGNKFFSMLLRILPFSLQLAIIEKFLRKGG